MHDIFYFTDIHGMYDLYRAIMDWCKEQDPEAMIIYGGDACDRGPDGYKIMKELLDNPQVVYLMGNHEDMFCKAAREIVEIFDFQSRDREKVENALNLTLHHKQEFPFTNMSIYNGGLQTLLDWVEDGAPIDIIERLEQLPLTFSTNGCDFCHAGGNPQVFEYVADDEYYCRNVADEMKLHVLWDRKHLEDMWVDGYTCVFGHTPVKVLPSKIHIELDESLDPIPVRIAKGTKIDMDTGAAFWGIAWVLNVLTMQAQGFEDIDIINHEISKHHIEKIYSVQV